MKRIIIKGGRLDEKKHNMGEIYPDLLITGELVKVFDVSEVQAEPKELMEDTGKWIIWSIEHNGWWKPNHNGYTQLRSEAGVYPYSEALSIVKGANINQNDVPNEAMIRI